jgi:virginiamycin B lyase
MRKSSARRVLEIELLESRWVPSGLTQGVANNIVTGLYREMLHRNPEPTALASFSGQLVAGGSVQQLVDDIWNSAEFHTREVTSYYQVYLGRNPDSVGLNGWVQAMGGGTTEASVTEDFLTSAEFQALHSGNADFVAALYKGLLYRGPDSTGLNNWVAALDGGVSRAAVVDGFLSSPEFHADRLTSLYSAILGRTADVGGLQGWLASWNETGAPIHTIESAFLTSSENVTNLTTLSGVNLASPQVTEYQLTYGDSNPPNTHDIVKDPVHPNIYWISSPGHDTLVQFDANTGQSTYFRMPTGSAPHGIAFDASDNLWLSLEAFGQVARIDQTTGAILQEIDVQLNGVIGAPVPINTSPHGIAFGADGQTLWFVGKATGTVGKINPDGTVNHYQLPTVGSTPIYIALGPDGNMWGTELTGNKIFRVTPTGTVTEFAIPTYNSRPIAIVPAPNGQPFMWFSEENGHAVAKIDMSGVITEFAIPKTQTNMLGAGLAFDSEGNLYAESYVNQNDPVPAGPDYIVKLSNAILTAPAGDLSNVLLTRYQLPSTGTVLHRIILGSDGNMYFTELGLDKVARLIVSDSLGVPAGYSFTLGI